MRKHLSIVVLCVLSAANAYAAVADYSGVYKASVEYSGYAAKLILGSTKGGYITGGIYYNSTSGDTTTNVALDEVNPAKSTVSSDGTFSGKTILGYTFSGTITLDGSSTTFRGTLKLNGVSIPFKGTRIYK